MTVLGFEEAFNSKLDIKVNDNLTIPVISVTGLCLLKLVAWIDRPRNLRPKDAQDIKFLLTHYDKLPNIHEALFDEGFAEKNGFEMHKASAAKLGNDVQKISSAPTTKFIISNLFKETQTTKFEEFILEMSQRDDSQIQQNLEMLTAFRDNFIKT